MWTTEVELAHDLRMPLQLISSSAQMLKQSLDDPSLDGRAYADILLSSVDQLQRLLGGALALILPAAGVRVRTTGLTGWLLVGAGALFAVILYQYLETTGQIHLPVLASLMEFNGQVVLVESVVMGYMAASALWFHGR